MDFSLTLEADTSLIKVGRSLTYHDYKKWRQVQNEAIATGCGRTIVDLTAITNIDSAGLGMLLSMKKVIDDKRTKMFIRFEGTGEVKVMLEKTGFSSLIPFCDD